MALIHDNIDMFVHVVVLTDSQLKDWKRGELWSDYYDELHTTEAVKEKLVSEGTSYNLEDRAAFLTAARNADLFNVDMLQKNHEWESHTYKTSSGETLHIEVYYGIMEQES